MMVRSRPAIIKRINSLKEYIEVLDFIKTNNPNKFILYRGQPEELSLLPAIARKNPNSDTSDTERKMLDEFKRRSQIRINKTIDSDWDWLVFAQHYGLKTRLLDWTSNPLIGLWFSCYEKSKWNADGIVFVFVVKENYLLNKAKDKTPFERDITKVYKPQINNERILAQAGWFTAHGFSPKTNRFIPLNESKIYSHQIKSIIIPRENKEQLIADLNILGFNHERLYPDVDGICKQLNDDYNI